MMQRIMGITMISKSHHNQQYDPSLNRNLPNALIKVLKFRNMDRKQNVDFGIRRLIGDVSIQAMQGYLTTRKTFGLII